MECTKQLGVVTTVHNGDRLCYAPDTVGNEVKIIVNNQVYNLGIEDGDLYIQPHIDSVYYTRPSNKVFLPQNVQIEFRDWPSAVHNIIFNAEFSEVEDSTYLILASFTFPECNLDKVMSDTVIEQLQLPIENENASPSGNLNNFSQIHAKWMYLIDLANNKSICFEDVPNEPAIEDYL